MILAGETLSQWRALPESVKSARRDAAWADGKTAAMPVAWADRLMAKWRARYGADHRAANLSHLHACRAIDAATRAGVRADAGDAEICEEARQSARDMGRRIAQRGQINEPAWPEGVKLLAQWAEVSHWLEGRGLWESLRSLLSLRTKARAVFARVTDERWWRRQLRRVHAKGIEATARGLGLVHKRGACYVSDEGLRNRAGQIARNAAALESVEARNEHGQSYTLAELAAKGPANREIRRHELMTRIAGFELIAKDCGHEAMFVTLTCPSRMHRMRTAGKGGVEENPKWDGTAPDEAQRYLSGQWAKARAAAARRGVNWYGFRIAEPNHDGTPHWHALLFVEGGAAVDAVAILRRYFLLASDPGERGAEEHRVKVERIDWKRGSAAGYVAKYVAKNIDGYKVEKDLYGNDAITSSQRVDAWAARWRIRQFQQIGGAPVTIWRELRRMNPDQAAASPGVELVLDAVNIASGAAKEITDQDRQQTAAHGWASYVALQGGPTAGRRGRRFHLLRESTGEMGRYGEVLPDKVVGVELIEVREIHRPAFGIIPASVRRESCRTQVESERATWIVVPKGFGLVPGGEAARPWSPVNNCTDQSPAPKPDRVMLSFAGIHRYPKKGRWTRWERSRGQPKEKSNDVE